MNSSKTLTKIIVHFPIEYYLKTYSTFFISKAKNFIRIFVRQEQGGNKKDLIRKKHILKFF